MGQLHNISKLKYFFMEKWFSPNFVQINKLLASVGFKPRLLESKASTLTTTICVLRIVEYL